MSIITVATSKGGAGKTTLAQIITGAASRNGHQVAAIEADLNHSLSNWISGLAEYPIHIETELNEANNVPLASKLESVVSQLAPIANELPTQKPAVASPVKPAPVAVESKPEEIV